MSPELQEYTKTVLSAGLWQLSPMDIMHHESVTTMVLHRYGCFQTELVIGHPNAKEWPDEHNHPNVDSVEVSLFNCSGFIRNGAVVNEPDFIVNGRACVILNHNDKHKVPVVKNGFCLLSIQQWLNGKEPTSVGLDWEGEPVSEGHKAQLGM